jgi:outer membrane protein insertion porin family
MIRLLGGCAVVTAFLLIQHSLRAQQEEPIVREIEIRFIGPETVNRALVTANIQTTLGKPRSRELIEQDVRSLVATGYFFDVRVLEEPVADGVRIVFQVQGKARLKDIVFEGQKRFPPERLKREVSQKVGDVLDERKAHADSLKIAELYQKAAYPDVKVTHESIIDKDTGKAILKFKIDEGHRVFIKGIKFSGNKAYPAKRLAPIFKTRRRWWGSWLAGTGVLKEEQFSEDLDKLRDFYRSNGYIDMEVRGTRVERIAKHWIIVHVDILEGQQYKVGDIKFEGNKLFPTTELERRLRMTTGKLFTPDGLSKDIKALEDFYGARGYLDTSARPARIPNVETGRIDLNYAIHEGELTYIERIEIRGNTKTKDKVIRRELAIVPGDIYDTVRVDRSQERLKNLGYFSKVEMVPEPTQIPNRKDLVVNVEEQRTGTVTFGAGFSSIDNLIGFVEVTQGNFDLFNWPTFTGGGQKLRVRAQVGIKRQDYVLSFTEPWFLDQRLALGFDLYHRENSFLSKDFSETRTGGDLRLSRAINQFTHVDLQYTLEDIGLSVSKSASQELRSQDGSKLRSSMQSSLIFDSRDSVFLTMRGNRTELTGELVGGPFGGDVSVYKLNAKTTQYFPFFNGHVLQILAAGGVVEAFGQTRGSGPVVDEDPSPFLHLVKVNDVPIFDRYFLGGANTLRGFSFRKIGPKDVRGEPVGGNTFVNATAEYTIPIVERVRLAAFFDIGEVGRDSYAFSLSDLKSDAGLGVRLNLPIGPLRLDYGYPLMTDKSTGTSGKIQFSIGYQF